jgi:hypothetical protein
MFPTPLLNLNYAYVDVGLLGSNASIFRARPWWGSIFLWNVGNYPQVHMALPPRRLPSTSSPPWEPEIPSNKKRFFVCMKCFQCDLKDKLSFRMFISVRSSSLGAFRFKEFRLNAIKLDTYNSVREQFLSGNSLRIRERGNTLPVSFLLEETQ